MSMSMSVSDANLPPDFPMTAAQLDVKAELAAGFQQKINSMQGLVVCIYAAAPV